MKILLTLLFLTTSLFAQTENNILIKKHSSKLQLYFEKLEKDQMFTAVCEMETREFQIEKFGRVLPKIAGECEWGGGGCPVNLVIPRLSAFAENLNMSGSVEVEIIVGENGKVICSKAIKGHKVFFAAALFAASNSRFRPLTLCGKRILQKKIIRYNFISN